MKSGYCSFVEKVCDDGKAWTYDWCSNTDYYGQAGQCVSEEKYNGCGKDSDCEDGNKCTINVCNSLSGTCKTVYENCNDNDSCTIDSCVPAWGCSNVTIECDDNNPCTTYDYCSGNGCYGMNKNCNDSDPSTTDSCNANTGACVHTPISTPPVVVPPTPGSTIKVEISCGAVACEVHPYFGADVGGKSFDNMGPAQANSWYSTDLPKTQLCVWGMEVAARLSSMPSLPWFGCDAGAPSLNTVSVKINGVVVPGVLTKHPFTCSGGGEGNLAFAKTVFGCP